MTPQRRTLVSALLLLSVVADLGLAVLAAGMPDLWFRLIHGVPRVDPEHMLTRFGVLWLTFALFHAAALALWRHRPYWLLIVAGMPLSEIFADVAWMLSAEHVTTLGRIAFSLAGPLNLGLAIFFIRSGLTAMRASPPPAPSPS